MAVPGALVIYPLLLFLLPGLAVYGAFISWGRGVKKMPDPVHLIAASTGISIACTSLLSFILLLYAQLVGSSFSYSILIISLILLTVAGLSLILYSILSRSIRGREDHSR